ncbi:hypothetical protein [Mycolicibacterium septicum]|uniref:hypothetical protein n=1 Tax=Mycolicibacterium septicum TaxID=98668 RepID=UPI001AFBE4FB|nr:hypothetical protein [Mycolicibacterium septicum]QRY51758.1 hypothetical protein JVX95_31030 [Mycolicibacterium septicum]
MALVYFAVTGSIIAVISDSSSDVDGTPEEQPVSSTVTFTPSVNEVLFEGKIVRLRPIRARTEEDGVLKNLDGTGVELAANCFGLDSLTYKVDFENVTYDKLHDQKLNSFRFAAPTDDTAVDLSTVTRLPL